MRLPPALATIIHEHASAAKPAIAAWRLGAYCSGGLRGLPLAISHRGDGPKAYGMVLTKDERGRLAVETDRERLRLDRTMFSAVWKRAGVFVDLISAPSVQPGAYRCELGDACTDPGRVLTFCSSNADNVLVPDRTFYLKDGYARERRQAKDAPAWADRSDVVLWRGGLNGWGLTASEPMSADNMRLMQRVRLCLSARDIKGTDVKVPFGWHCDPELLQLYTSHGIAGSHVAQVEWTRRKFAVDIDGNANAFSNLYVRLLYGCCVLKVASPSGLKQWYYDRLKPWTHYVPVAADLSDMAEKIAWCRDNDDVCAGIASAGQRLALSMTRATEKRAALERISGAGGG